MVWKSVGAKYKADALFFGGRAPPYSVARRIGPGPSGPAQCILASISRAKIPRIKMPIRTRRQIPKMFIRLASFLRGIILYNIIPENVKLLY